MLDRLLDHLLVDLALLRIADGARVNAAQHAPRRQILRILPEHFLGFGHSRFQLVALDVQIRKLLEHKRSRRIELQRLLVVIDRLGVVIAAIPVRSRLLGIVVAHGEVVVGPGFIGSARRRLGLGEGQAGWK